MQTTIDRPREVGLESTLGDQLRELRVENDRLRAENQRLRHENRELRATLDSHISRAGSTALFGPVELTAGTSVGPRRRRG